MNANGEISHKTVISPYHSNHKKTEETFNSSMYHSILSHAKHTKQQRPTDSQVWTGETNRKSYLLSHKGIEYS